MERLKQALKEVAPIMFGMAFVYTISISFSKINPLRFPNDIFIMLIAWVGTGMVLTLFMVPVWLLIEYIKARRS